MDDRARFLDLLRARVINIAEMELVGFAGCGMLCPGGSESRGCTCTSPKACALKDHPFYGAYVQYRNSQMQTDWFIAPESGSTRIRMTVSEDGTVAFDTETMG